MQFPFQLLRHTEFDVVGFGTNAVDHLIRVPEYPAFDSKVKFTGYTKDAGGEVASTLVGLQRLGSTTAYVGRFGSDIDGEFGLQTLIDEGVDTSYAEIVPGASTQIAFIVIDEQTGERTIIWHRDDRLRYRLIDAPLAIAARGKVLHLTPHDTRTAIEMAKMAKKHGVITSIDIDNMFDGVDELLPLIDICTASASFPAKFTGLPDDRSAMREIAARFGCAMVGITRGREGSIFLCEGVFIESPAFDVPNGCQDTTGAGDAFRAGLLYGLLTGETVEESARAANAVAALKCRKFGARSGLPDQQDLKTLLKNI